MWTFDEMSLRDLTPELVSYNRAIRGCSDEGEWEMTLSLVLEAQARGITPDRTSFEWAMVALEKAKQATRAHDLLGKMKEVGVMPEKSMLDTVVSLLRQSGESEKADAVAKEIELRYERGGDESSS